MSLYSLEGKNQNISKVKFQNNQKKKMNENFKLERIANNFISSIFKSVIVNYKKEKEIISNHIYSLRKEERNKIIVSNFVNALFKEIKIELMNSKIKSRNISNKKCFKNYKSFFISSNKKTTNGTKDKNIRNSYVKNEYTISNKCKRIFKANSNISCDTNVSTFEKENKYIKSFNTTNKKIDKKINIQSDSLVSNICSRFIQRGEKCKTNHNLNEKHKLINGKQGIINNKILILKYRANKTKNNFKKEKNIIEKVFKYDYNGTKLQKIKKVNTDANIDMKNRNNKNCSGINKVYKHIILKNTGNKNIINKIYRNNNERNFIQKINIVRVYDKKLIQQRKKIFSDKNDN